MSRRKAGIRVSLLCALLIAYASPAAAATDGDRAELGTAIPPRFTGELQVAAREIAATWSEDAPPAGRWEAESATLLVKRVRYKVVESPFGDVGHSPEYANESHELGALIATARPGPGFVAYARGLGRAEVSYTSPAQTPLEFERNGEWFRFGMNSSLPFFYRDENLETPLLMPADGSRWSLSGEAELLIANSELEIASDEGTQHLTLGSRTTRDPLTPAMRTEEYSFVVLQMRGAHIQNETSQTLRVKVTALLLDGTLSFYDANGNIDAERTNFPNVAGPVKLAGVIESSEPAHSETGWHYTLGGNFVTVDMADGRSYRAVVAEGAAVAGGLAALAAAISATGRKALGSFIGALYTRIAPSGALKSPARKQLYLLIGEAPGTHLREIQRALGWGWGTLHYHTSVLRRSHLVVLEKSGKHLLLYPVGRNEKLIADALRVRGMARRIYGALDSGAGRTQNELVAQLGLSRQLVGHHLKAMERDGLVEAAHAPSKAYRRVAAHEPQ